MTLFIPRRCWQSRGSILKLTAIFKMNGLQNALLFFLLHPLASEARSSLGNFFPGDCSLLSWTGLICPANHRCNNIPKKGAFPDLCQRKIVKTNGTQITRSTILPILGEITNSCHHCEILKFTAVLQFSTKYGILI